MISMCPFNIYKLCLCCQVHVFFMILLELQICERETDDIKELFTFRKTIESLISKNAKTQDDILDELQSLTDQTLKVSFTKGSTAEELRAVKIEIAKD